jgi:hypothetical protein
MKARTLPDDPDQIVFVEIISPKRKLLDRNRWREPAICGEVALPFRLK